MYLSRLARIEIRKREEKVWAHIFSNLRSAVQKGRGKELIFFYCFTFHLYLCVFASHCLQGPETLVAEKTVKAS